MTTRRIVSFLPSATEMVCALGLSADLVGVTHECDYPEDVKNKPVVVRPILPLQTMSQREIDVAVSARLRAGQSLYQVDEELMRKLKPDLLLTQSLCEVCAPSGNEVAQLLKSLEPEPDVLWLTPKSLEQINDNIRDVGRATGRLFEAENIIASGREKLRKIADVTKTRPYRPRVFCMEWIDPVYCSGHWVPEMVERAGGVDSLSRKGTDSVRIPWEDVLEWDPEILVIMPCGYRLTEALAHVPPLFSLPGWAHISAVRNGKVYAVDANSYFARPGPRVVQGTELLAHLIHPDLFEWKGPENVFQRLR